MWKNVKLFLKFQYHKRRHKHAPLVALLHLTSRCNLNCRYCYTEHRGEFPDLTVEKWKWIIDELKKRGCELIFLMGGEPLLYERVEELVDYVKEKGMQCHLTTNGILIPEHIAALKKVDLLMVSLDGNERGNNLNRGCFEQVIAGIETAKKERIPLRINSVLTRNTVVDVDWLLEFGESIGAFVGFTIPAKGKDSEGVKGILLDNEEILKVHQKLLDLQKDGKKITLSEKSLRHVIEYPKSYEEIIYKGEELAKGYSECCYGRYIVFFDSEGSVYPCTTLWEQKDIFQPKNVFRDGFDEAARNAWNLPCWICYCAGGVEWNEMSSFRGLKHALRFTFGNN